jgi:hypothetical protein
MLKPQSYFQLDVFREYNQKHPISGWSYLYVSGHGVWLFINKPILTN